VCHRSKIKGMKGFTGSAARFDYIKFVTIYKKNKAIDRLIWIFEPFLSSNFNLDVFVLFGVPVRWSGIVERYLTGLTVDVEDSHVVRLQSAAATLPGFRVWQDFVLDLSGIAVIGVDRFDFATAAAVFRAFLALQFARSSSENRLVVVFVQNFDDEVVFFFLFIVAVVGSY
jgi:hypothetical protein